MYIWLPRRRVDPTRRPVLSLSSARVHAKTRSLALERSSSRVKWLMNDDGEVEASRLLVSMPWITLDPAAFRWHASRKKNKPSWCLFPFRMAAVLLLRTAWIADILSQASLRDVRRQRYWKRGTCSRDGQSLWDYCTARLSDLSVPLTGEVWRPPEPSARPTAAADSEERQICTTCFFAEGARLWRDDGLMLSPIVEHTSVWEGLGEEGRFDVASRSETPKTTELPKPQTATVATAQWPK